MTQPDPADYWTGPAVWLFNPLGYAPGAVMFIGPTLFPAGLDPANTKTAMFVLGPGGGQMTVPGVVTGPAGPSPTLRKINYTPVPYGDALPDPPAEFVNILPGVYDLDIAVQQGQPGESGSFSIADAQDFSGSPADRDVPIWDAATSKFNPGPMPLGVWYNATSIPTTTDAAGQIRTLQSLTIPPQPKPYIPLVFAAAEVFGTASTQVDLVARLGGSLNSQSGQEVGRGLGLIGAAPPPPSIIPVFMGGLLTSGFGQVAAGSSATIFLNAEQQQATTDTYSTGRAGFSVCAAPVAA